MYQIVPNPGSKSIFVAADNQTATSIACSIKEQHSEANVTITGSGTFIRCCSNELYFAVAAFFVDRYLEPWI